MTYIKRRLLSSDGFSLVEAIVAGMILVIGLIPLIGMFDTSFRGLVSLNKRFVVGGLVKSVVEELKRIPFYIPHNQQDVNQVLDFDDRFWGDRTPTWDNPWVSQDYPAPNWDAVPEVMYFDYGGRTGYEDFKATVKMVYVDDSLNVVSLRPGWGPKTPGADRPTTADNNPVNNAIFKVTLYVRGDGVMDVVAGEAEEVISSFHGVYNLGISSIEVISPDSVKDPDKPNAASHYPDVTVYVKIKGWGFNDAVGPQRAAFSLVRSGYNDIPITLTSLSKTEANGYFRLYDTANVTDNPWRPRAPIGYWSVRVKQDLVVSSYLHNGFVVQYPIPKVVDFGFSEGYIKTVVKGARGYVYIRGKNLMWLDFTYGGDLQNCLVKLIARNQDGEVVGELLPSRTEAVSVPNGGYTNSDCVIRAEFDFSSAIIGNYSLLVANTAFSGKPGYTKAETNPILQVVPGSMVPDLYVNEFVPLSMGFWANYYDIPSVLRGAGLSYISSLTLKRGTTSYSLRAGTEWVVLSDSEIWVNLNLIGCSPGTWSIEAQDVFGRMVSKDFVVTQGKIALLPPERGAVTIKYERGLFTRGESQEAATTKAFALNSYYLLVPIYGRARFVLMGMGFPIPGSGTVNIRVYGDGLDRTVAGNVTMRRDEKVVMVEMQEDVTMPFNRTGFYNLEISLAGDPTNKETHIGRWRLLSDEP